MAPPSGHILVPKALRVFNQRSRPTLRPPFFPKVKDWTGCHADFRCALRINLAT
ncbi:MAG: hypothetical protein Q9204_003280 [Flavoplaca sp. TL-2023a]